MHVTREATLHTWRCDMPHCQQEVETYAVDSDYVGAVYPGDWRSVRLSGDGEEADRLLLCPKHATHKPLLQLVIQLLNTRTSQKEHA